MTSLTLYQTWRARESGGALLFVPDDEVEACKTYRDACRLAWRHRRLKGLLFRTLAEEAGACASHVTDWFHPDELDRKGKRRRELPARLISEVERVLGNRAITQYQAMNGDFSILEHLQQREAARRTVSREAA